MDDDRHTCVDMGTNPSISDKYLIEARGIICRTCRQRLSSAALLQCPCCKASNPAASPTYLKSGSGSAGSSSKDRSKIGNRITSWGSDHHRRNKGGDHHQPSLNCKPSPLGYSSPSPKKRALLVGVTYKSWKHKLKGTINDVKNMRNFLIHSCGFKEQNILVLTEEEEDKVHTPTKKNMLISLEWLVKDSKAGDSLVFYFSGHGIRQPDFQNDERDGYDETICPVDFMEEGMIFDNDINEKIVWPLITDVTLHAIIDACHSGTMLDLIHVYNRKEGKWEDNSPPSGTQKHTNGGLAISISACEDNQVAADTSAFTGKEMTGAMTHILIETLKSRPGLTYGELLDVMHQTLEDANKSPCFPTRILRLILNNRLLQRPQLSASQPFDVYDKHFEL